MATSYINTGVLGQVTGGTLSIGGLKPQYESYKEKVLSRKRSISGVSEAEREAQRKRKEAQLAQSQEETGAAVQTGDIASLVKQAPQAPLVAGPTTLAPEKQFTEADRAFAAAYETFSTSISSKAANNLKSNAGKMRARYQAVVDAAAATGRQELIDAVGGIEGLGTGGAISARNVGTIKASTAKAGGAIRGVLDIDTLMREDLRAYKSPVVSARLAIGGILKKGLKF